MKASVTPLARRAAHALLRAGGVAAGVVVIAFLLVRLIPGDAATALLGSRATPTAVAQLRERLGLDEPLPAQFWHFLSRLVTHGDTGTSLVNGVPTRELILARLEPTLWLVAFATVFAVALSVPLALWAATHRDGLADHVVRILTTAGIAMPAFWTGLLLILLFSVRLGWFPVGGVRDGYPTSIVLPALTAAIAIVPVLVRSLRAELVEVLRADFVATLRAAGLPERRILARHVLRNAALPALVLVGTNISYLLGGALIVEKVFALPGLGDLMFDAIGSRDLPVIQGVVIYTALAVVLVTLVTDHLAAVLDPRLRRAA
ncbi:ABC transporter permease [Streptomyces shenzhenensis]